MVFGIAGFVALVVLMGISAWGVRSQKNVTTKAAALKSTCTGSWTCTKGTQSFTYQCANYAGGTEALCTGGGNGQGNYCNTVGGWARTGSCTWSSGPTPTPVPLTKLQTPEVSCRVVGKSGSRFVKWTWNAVNHATDYYVMVDGNSGWPKHTPSSFAIVTSDTTYEYKVQRGSWSAKVQAFKGDKPYNESDYSKSKTCNF